MYKLIKSIVDGKVKFVIRLTDNANIPFDPANTDYQAYLKWVDEGGITEPANE